MSAADEPNFSVYHIRDAVLPVYTADAVGEALEGFPLPLRPQYSLDWLAMAIRRALSITVPNGADGPDRLSNSELKLELVTMAEAATHAWLALFKRSRQIDSCLWNQAFKEWSGVNALAAADDPQFGYNRFLRALTELDWIGGLLRRAAIETPDQKGNWRDAERKRKRIERAQALAPIFEDAFGRRVTANNFGNDARFTKPTPFMDFYKRIIPVAFGNHEIANLSEVVKEACRQHRNDPYHYLGNFIPGLSGGAVSDHKAASTLPTII